MPQKVSKELVKRALGINKPAPEARVYNHLCDLIVDLKLQPGTQLTALSLAKRLNASSTPVREALVQLTAQTMIEYRPNKGFFTRPACLSESNDEYLFAMFLLRKSISMHSDHGTRAQLFAPFLALGEGSYDFDASIMFVEELIKSTGAMSRNKSVRRAIDMFCLQTRTIRKLDLVSQARRDQAIQQLSDVARQLIDGDLEAAADTLDDRFHDKMRRLPNLVFLANAIALDGSINLERDTGTAEWQADPQPPLAACTFIGSVAR